MATIEQGSPDPVIRIGDSVEYVVKIFSYPKSNLYTKEIFKKMNKEYQTVQLYITPMYANSSLSCSVSGPDWVYLHDNILYFYPDREVTKGSYSVKVSVIELPSSGNHTPEVDDLTIKCHVLSARVEPI